MTFGFVGFIWFGRKYAIFNLRSLRRVAFPKDAPLVQFRLAASGQIYAASQSLQLAEVSTAGGDTLPSVVFDALRD